MTPAQKRYRDYLGSPHWIATRTRILVRADGHCEWCHRFCGPNPHPELDGPCVVHGDDPAHRCEFCREYFDYDGYRNDAEQQSLEVHHRTYQRLGRELDSDLVALCWSCHDGVTDRFHTLKLLHAAGKIAAEDATLDVAATRFGSVALPALIPGI